MKFPILRKDFCSAKLDICNLLRIQSNAHTKACINFNLFERKLFAASQDGLIYKFDFSGSLSGMTECSSQLLPLNERIGMISVSNSGDLAVASDNHELVRFYKMNGSKFEDPKLATKCVGSTDALALNSSGSVLICSGK